MTIIEERKMTIIEALKNALEALENEGLVSGDIHDDLELVITRLRNKHQRVAEEKL